MDAVLVCSICSLVLTLLYCLSAVVNVKQPKYISPYACLVNSCLLVLLNGALIGVVTQQLLPQVIYLLRTSVFLINVVDVS